MVPSFLLQALEAVWRPLDTMENAKAIAGGLALSYWGYPRSTQDIDLAILTEGVDIVDQLMSQYGFIRKNDGRTTDLGFLKVSQWLYPFPDYHLDVAIDLLISDSPYFRMAIERAISCRLPGTITNMRVLTCEDLILFKASAGRLIDRADIEQLIQVNSDQLDRAYLRNNADLLGIYLRL